MSDDGSTKDDVKIPDGDVGDKINKLFTEDQKDTSKILIKLCYRFTKSYRCHCSHCHGRGERYRREGGPQGCLNRRFGSSEQIFLRTMAGWVQRELAGMDITSTSSESELSLIMYIVEFHPAFNRIQNNKVHHKTSSIRLAKP